MVCNDPVTHDDVCRIQRQARRLRNRLAEAWCDRCSPSVIARLESLLRRRWTLLEQAHSQHRRPKPE